MDYENLKQETDAPWKYILSKYFKSFLELCFPERAKEIKRFPIIKLIDYNQKLLELESSTNPFSIIIMTQLAALKKQQVELKLASKLQITKKLYTSGFNRNEVVELFRFIDWAISLPKEMEIKFMKSVSKLEKEEFEKNFICPAERIWIEQGIEKIALRMLSKESITMEEISSLTGITVTQLKKLKSRKH